jgi:hypothetical protein
MRSNLSPREFLKARRPERFSDSTVADVSELDRGILEYHLESLTNRSQEKEFENFARALIKLEICPNLLPQTGPTGGGDSKVDSETYPVADSLALTWYVGEGRIAAVERWGFAFSAKAKWSGKLRSDIGKIVATNRGYKKAFFVTNQYVRDKTRAELEDELSKLHKLDVRILDRTWILDVVFDHRRQDVAITELGVSSSIRKDVRVGPLDLERETELKRIEDRISASIAKEEFSFVVVDECIDAAILSRELERPKTETLGRFERADAIAAKCGTQQQSVRCAYDRAWTTLFWFEDIQKFAELYKVVEERARDSRNIYELELLTTLWMLLHGNARENADFEEHTAVLTASLKAIASNDETPTAALEARAYLLKIDLTLAVASRNQCGSQLRALSEIIQEAESLAGFPFLPLAETLIALGGILGEVSGYDELYVELVEAVSRRKGEVEGARLLLQRAEQQLASDRPIDAIGTIGNALQRLAKDESRKTFGVALYVCGCAYERIGLLWAARGTLLMAASISMSDLWKYEDVTPFQAVCLGRLKWIELQLGRIPHVLSWHEVDSLIRGILIAQGYDESHLFQGMIEFDSILGILLLNADYWELKEVVRLPDQLSAMGLNAAAVALLHALGHDSEFKSEIVSQFNDSEDNAIFVKWRDQPASEDLPDVPNFCNHVKVELCSRVLGCAIRLTTPNSPPFVELGESYLAALECTLATGLVRNLFARVPIFNATIVQSDFCKEPLEFSMAENAGYPHLTISCREFNPDKLGMDKQRTLKERIFEMVALTVAHLVIPDQDRIENLFLSDAAISRAINFSGSFQVLGNVLGEKRKRHTSDWVDKLLPEFTVNRSCAWDADAPRKKPEAEVFKLGSNGMSRMDDQAWRNRFQSSKHSKWKTLSLIRESLWNKAKWLGIGVVAFADSPPILAIIFREREPATQIFNHWAKEIGKIEDASALRICIIKHVDKKQPSHYRVVIGSNVEQAEVRRVEFFTTMSRIHTMTPESSNNLDSFLEAYSKFSKFWIAPAVVDRSGQYPDSIGDFRILKHDLTVKEAWEIGRHDIDMVGILPGDDPIVPEGVDKPPVKELLEYIRDQAQDEANRQEAVQAAKKTEASRKQKMQKKKDKAKRKQSRQSRRNS